MAHIRDLLQPPRPHHWKPARKRPKSGRARVPRGGRSRVSAAEWRFAALLGTFLGLLYAQAPIGTEGAGGASSGALEQSAFFGLCDDGAGGNCVIDGDTFRLDGEKIRVADIDTPETHPPRCVHEASLGSRATLRMQALLNAGPFTLEPAARDEDRYGRKLGVVRRNGESLGDMLVEEGLAREWSGRREPWC